MKNSQDGAADNILDRNCNFRRHTSADFARAITLAEFGWRNGKMLDQADFRDRPPGRFPAPAPEAGQS